MVDTPLFNWAFALQAGLSARTLAQRFSEVVNVKNYGAVGDGVHNDSPNIQAAFDAAFGSAAAPHAVANSHLNKPVFFPGGKYACLQPVILNDVYGGHIYGSGRLSTVLQGDGNTVLQTNGMSRTAIERMQFTAPGGSGTSCIDLDWDGTGPVGLNNNRFSDIFVDQGAYGVRIGKSNNDGAGNHFFEVFLLGCSQAGMSVESDAAKCISITACNPQNNNIGVWVQKGNISSMENVSAQQSALWDIKIEAAASGCLSIAGCRGESTNFLYAGPNTSVVASAIGHRNANNVNGTLFEIHGQAVIEDVMTDYGNIKAVEGARIAIRICQFDRSDWLTATPSTLWRTGAGNPVTAYIEAENITYGGGQINKQRIFTSNGSTLTTQNYQVS